MFPQCTGTAENVEYDRDFLENYGKQAFQNMDIRTIDG